MICSSKREYITIAAAPACSSCKAVSSFFDSGDADATRGFFKGKPRYVVFISTIGILLAFLNYID
jgi:hypothetical protein